RPGRSCSWGSSCEFRNVDDCPSRNDNGAQWAPFRYAVRTSEPQVGIEPTTARLRIECSTPELLWHHLVPMPWRGLEPRRLAAPPPQDGVSTNFTTRALAARTPRDIHIFKLQRTA